MFNAFPTVIRQAEPVRVSSEDGDNHYSNQLPISLDAVNMNVSIPMEEDDFNHDSLAPVEEDDLNTSPLISIHIQDDLSGNSLASVEEDVSDDSSPVPVGEDDSNHGDRPSISHEGSVPSSYASINDLPDTDQRPVIQLDPVELPVPASPPSIFRRGGAPLSQNSFAFRGSLPLHRGNRKMHSVHPREPPRKVGCLGKEEPQPISLRFVNVSEKSETRISELQSQLAQLKAELARKADLHESEMQAVFAREKESSTQAARHRMEYKEAVLHREAEALQYQDAIKSFRTNFTAQLAPAFLLAGYDPVVYDLQQVVSLLQQDVAIMDTINQENLLSALRVFLENQFAMVVRILDTPPPSPNLPAQDGGEGLDAMPNSAPSGIFQLEDQTPLLPKLVVVHSQECFSLMQRVDIFSKQGKFGYLRERVDDLEGELHLDH
ncbi:hypothetical protein EDD85DRAFT_797311 [Armillaria nabsnona]|nr:hypothetical protein EDD85DRAFT_797311 [Armillaria nabsnona]